jgi:hypothetical protein
VFIVKAQKTNRFVITRVALDHSSQNSELSLMECVALWGRPNNVNPTKADYSIDAVATANALTKTVEIHYLPLVT